MTSSQKIGKTQKHRTSASAVDALMARASKQVYFLFCVMLFSKRNIENMFFVILLSYRNTVKVWENSKKAVETLGIPTAFVFLKLHRNMVYFSYFLINAHVNWLQGPASPDDIYIYTQLSTIL